MALNLIRRHVFIVLQVKMKSRFPSPPQGQVEACVKLQAAAPEDAEFYVVVQGSALTHVTQAKRGADAVSLGFIVPGIFLILCSLFRSLLASTAVVANLPEFHVQQKTLHRLINIHTVIVHNTIRNSV